MDIQSNIEINLKLLYPSKDWKYLKANWDTVLYCMCESLDHTIAQQWALFYPPVVKQQQRDYKSNLFKFLESLKRKGCIPPFIMFRKSDIEDLKGPRFDRLVLALSNHVIERKLEERGQKVVFPDAQPKGVQLKILTVTSLIQARALPLVDDSVVKYESAKAMEEEASKCMLELESRIKAVSDEITALSSQMDMEAMEKHVLEKEILYRQMLDEFNPKHGHLFAILSEFQRRPELESIEPRTLKASELIPRFSKTFSNRDIGRLDLFTDGKLDLVLFLQVWTKCIQMIQRELVSSNI